MIFGDSLLPDLCKALIKYYVHDGTEKKSDEAAAALPSKLLVTLF